MTDPLKDLIRLCLKITHMSHSKERFILVKSINVMLEKFPEELHGNPVANHVMIAVIVAISADMKALSALSFGTQYLHIVTDAPDNRTSAS
jgi:hypothetical protein